MLPLPNGPWSPVVIGNWDGIRISYYHNPDKEMLIFIFDKKAGKIQGVVMLMARFFLVNGDFSKALDNFSDGNVVMLKKKTPTFNLNYVAVVTDPVYAKFKSGDIVRTFNNLMASLDNLSTEFRKLAAKTGMPITELKNANEEVVHRLFGEPLALPTTIIRKAGEGTMLDMNIGKLNLGLKTTGEKAVEVAQSLVMAAIIGKMKEKILQVVMEEAVLNGMTVILYDEDGRFETINKPNPSLDGYEKFELSQPMGMPTRAMEPGIEVFIEISLFNPELLTELFGLGEDAEKVFEEAMKSEPQNLKELSSSIENISTKKFIHERVLRVLKFIEREHGDLFNGENDAREILAPWLKKMGRITYIKLSEVPENLQEGIKLSVTKAIHRFLKSEAPKAELKSISVINHKKGKIFDDYFKTLKVLTTYGHGIIYCVDDEIDADQEYLGGAKLVIKSVDKDDAVILTPGKKEYRIKVRPTLSNPTS